MAAAQPVRALTSVRGIAAWFVVVFHFREALPAATPGWVQLAAAHGYLAVDLFFMMSGFVIALNYARQFEGGADARGLLTFYGFRLARIYPLHLFMLLAYLSVPAALVLFSRSGLPEAGFDPEYYVASLLLIQNWGMFDELRWNIPAWSISTEWFAYLVFPLLVLAITRRLRTAGATLALLGGLLLLLGGVTWWQGGGLGSDIPRFGLLRCVIEFGIGMCIHRVCALRGGAPAAGPAFALGALLCLGSVAFVADYLLAPLGFVLLIFHLLDGRNGLARLLENRGLEWLGLVSYSTYLSHYLIKVWVKFLLEGRGFPEGLPLLAYLLATLAASALLFHLVEKPGQRWGRALVLAAGQPVGRLRRP
ncbi:acyltransferase [Roseomonas frigidaquae]|uniref:Acyltransferase n=1 Tax=Falsiroseomonas frigidaquae TaxID=487318 RepID=A0ABX1EW89_9PROT|nr:acyltransferase [Falsiroseomonas frigidaquae]NKE44029.1 acyltransferase [Falsiroseomonas frigidaquae]